MNIFGTAGKPIYPFFDFNVNGTFRQTIGGIFLPKPNFFSNGYVNKTCKKCAFNYIHKTMAFCCLTWCENKTTNNIP